MKRVLVLGATGAMGRYLVPEDSEIGLCMDEYLKKHNL